MARGRMAAGRWRHGSGAGDVSAQQLFADQYLHLGSSRDMPDVRPTKSNSGVFIQGRYELQLLDSSSWARRDWATAAHSQ